MDAATSAPASTLDHAHDRHPLVKAGLQRDSSEAGGIAQSLDTLARAPFGRIALGVVALGLMAYGMYQLATARYRHIRTVG
jgi:hypothetical protein